MKPSELYYSKITPALKDKVRKCVPHYFLTSLLHYFLLVCCFLFGCSVTCICHIIKYFFGLYGKFSNRDLAVLTELQRGQYGKADSDYQCH